MDPQLPPTGHSCGLAMRPSSLRQMGGGFQTVGFYRMPTPLRGTPGLDSYHADSEVSMSLGSCSWHLCWPSFSPCPHTAHSLLFTLGFDQEETGAIPAPAPPEPAGERRMDVQLTEASSSPQDRLKVTCSGFTQGRGSAFQVKFRGESHCF